MKPRHLFVAIALAVGASAWAQPTGEIKGEAVSHTSTSAAQVIRNAQLALPASVTGAAPYLGPLSGAPQGRQLRVPLVVFMHGSSGLGLKAIGEWQQWLASIGIASIAPDSFALPDRLTYKSPVDKATYEKIHALRASEIALAASALPTLPWVDSTRVVLAGTSEGTVAVARYSGDEFAGRIMFSWSCEDNYFVQSHSTAIPLEQPVLNVISAADPFFSGANSWLGNANASGHCGTALKSHKKASIVLIPGAPHTLMNLAAARQPVEGFLRDVFKTQ